MAWGPPRAGLQDETLPCRFLSLPCLDAVRGPQLADSCPRVQQATAPPRGSVWGWSFGKGTWDPCPLSAPTLCLGVTGLRCPGHRGASSPLGGDIIFEGNMVSRATLSGTVAAGHGAPRALEMGPHVGTNALCSHQSRSAILNLSDPAPGDPGQCPGLSVLSHRCSWHQMGEAREAAQPDSPGGPSGDPAQCLRCCGGPGGAGASAAILLTAKSTGGLRDPRTTEGLSGPPTSESPGTSAEHATGASSREGDPVGAHGPRGAGGMLAPPPPLAAAQPGGAC